MVVTSYEVLGLFKGERQFFPGQRVFFGSLVELSSCVCLRWVWAWDFFYDKKLES